MRRRNEGPSGSQAEREDMERMSGSTGATSSGMQDTGSTYQPGHQESGYQQGYQQQGYQETGTRAQASTSYGQAPAHRAEYGTSGYGRPTSSRHGSALAILAGSLAFLMGLAFVIRSGFYHATVAGYAYRWNLHGWGYTLMVLGALLFAAGVSHLLAIKGSRYIAAALAVITAVVAFLVIFYSVVWSIVVVAACAFAAHDLLSRRGADEQADAGYGAGGQSYGGMSQREREEAMSQGKRSRL